MDQQCRICESHRMTLTIDLGDQPWGNHFLTEEEIGQEPFYPLQVFVCNRCRSANLGYTVKKEVMFANHTYLSGTTRSLAHHFDCVAKEVDKRFFKNQTKKAVLDIGSNDGTQLLAYRRLGYEILGVESAKRVAKIANNGGVTTIQAFFNLALAKTIPLRFDVINASGVFFHLEELHSVTEAIKFLLKEEGVFVVQFLYMGSIFENKAFDQIYHEHLLYYTLKSIETLLNMHRLALFDAYWSSIHGGSIIGFVGHQGGRGMTQRLEQLRAKEEIKGYNELQSYKNLAREMIILKQENRAYLEAKKKEGKILYGMGAPVKGNTLLNYFDIGRDFLDCLVEKNPLRKGLYSPGKHLPVVLEDELSSPPDIYYVLAWNFKDEILNNHRHLIDQGVEFYFPIKQAGLCVF